MSEAKGTRESYPLLFKVALSLLNKTFTDHAISMECIDGPKRTDSSLISNKTTITLQFLKTFDLVKEAYCRPDDQFCGNIITGIESAAEAEVFVYEKKEEDVMRVLILVEGWQNSGTGATLQGESNTYVEQSVKVFPMG